MLFEFVVAVSMRMSLQEPAFCIPLYGSVQISYMYSVLDTARPRNCYLYEVTLVSIGNETRNCPHKFTCNKMEQILMLMSLAGGLDGWCW